MSACRRGLLKAFGYAVRFGPVRSGRQASRKAVSSLRGVMSLSGFRKFLSLAAALVVVLSAQCPAICQALAAAGPGFTLDEKSATTLAAKVDELVTSKFFDKEKVEKTWRPSYEANRQLLVGQTNLLDFSRKMNELLMQLQTSHTQFLTENDEAFFFMRSLFGARRKDDKDPNKNDADFTGLGVGGGKALPGQVRYVLDGSPAAAAGFKRGDRIKSVNGHDYTGYASWYQQSGNPCQVIVERQGKTLELKITPVRQDFLKGYLAATEKSARIIDCGEKKIGYLHFWCGGEGTHEALVSALGSTFVKTDALILDLRDGYGAASMDDLDMFFRPRSAFPDMRSYNRKGSYWERSVYDKPLVVLTNRGTRSGKELLSFGLKRSKRATLIGDTTAGFVVGGEFNPLDKRAVLFLATVDITLDGKRLEGKGVAPDIRVEDRLGPDDPVLERALELLRGRL
jgi:carboxyl-terminal processing protease